MGLQVVVMFIDAFMDGVAYVRDVAVSMQSMICYIPGCICYVSENFGLGSLHDDYVGLDVATPQFYSVAPYRFDYRFVDEKFVFYRQMGYFSINQLPFLFLSRFVFFFWRCVLSNLTCDRNVVLGILLLLFEA